MNSKFFALLGVSLVAFVSLLDYTIINTALPTLQKSFGVSILSLQWVFNVYCIVVSIFMIINGRLGDIYGRRRVFYMGSLILAIGSIGAGLSKNFETLIFFRAIQSFGVAATVPLGVSLVNCLYEEKAHHAMSFYSAVTGVALAIGPFIGGWVVTHWGWPWIFYINIPLLLIGFSFSLPFLPEFKSSEKITLDFLGLLLLAITLISLIYGLIHGEQTSWENPLTLLLFAIFVITLPILFKVEKKQKFPLINFHFFRNPLFSLAAIGCISAGILISAAIFFSPLFLEQVIELSPKYSGMFLLMVPIAIVFCSPLIGRMMGKIGPKNILFYGLVLGLVTAILYLLSFKTLSLVMLSLSFLLTGLFWAMINIGSGVGAGSSVEPSQAGVAVGTVFSLWNISAAVAIATTSVLFHSNSYYINSLILSTSKGINAAFIFVAIIMAILTLISWLILLSKK
jgi:EmrB/QacA subfamily drug resistance transporter